MKLICPKHGNTLRLSRTSAGNNLQTDCGCSFQALGKRLWNFLPAISKGRAGVKDFYEESPFPNYNEFESFDEFFAKGVGNSFTMRIARSITENSNVVEVGCGTGQLVNFLSAISPASYIGFDLTEASLKLADEFAYSHNLSTAFIQGDVYTHPFEARSFDTVISLGVLHHTVDCERALKIVSELVSNDGQIIIGLYNTYGRLWTDLRRAFLRKNAGLLNRADQHLRGNLSPGKRLAWIRDQYFHPLEEKYSIEWTINRLSENGFRTFSTIPLGIDPSDSLVFKSIVDLDFCDVRLGELNMLFDTYGSEGGLHIVWAKR